MIVACRGCHSTSSMAVLIIVALGLAIAGEKSGAADFPAVEPHQPIALPEHFQTPQAQTFDNTPDWNPTTPDGVALGRVLFYDRRLSGDGTISCGSCHQQRHAFSDPHRLSVGVGGVVGDRNAMSLINLRFIRQGFFWDERAPSLEAAVLKPIENRVEMNNSMESVVRMVSQDENYAPLFKKAFGEETVTSKRIARALAQFVRSIISYRSAYDKGIAKTGDISADFPNYCAKENQGKNLFLEHCAICHHPRGGQQAFFTMFTTLNNGIDPNIRVADAGQGAVTFLPADLGSFRAPSLRNVARTAPYAHDGRFETLLDVVNHYSEGVNRHPNTSGLAIRMQFTEAEKEAIVAFLRTLTDAELLNDPRYADPWNHETETYTDTFEVTSSAGSVAEETIQGAPDPLTDLRSWLVELDWNGDGHWTQKELEPLAARLQKSEFPRRLADYGRRGPGARERRRSRTEETPSPAAIQSDLSDLFRLDDLGRDLSRLNRFVDGLKLSDRKRETVWHRIQQARLDHFQQIDGLVVSTTNAVKEILNPKQLTPFQAAMVNERGRSSGRDRRIKTRKEAATFLETFNTDGSDDFNRSELDQIMTVIGRLPGGLDSSAPSRPTIQTLAARYFVRDTDGDDYLSPEELPPRVRTVLMPADNNGDELLSRGEVTPYVVGTSFSKFLEDGIYVGGGFESAYTIGKRALDEINITSAQKQELSDLFSQHVQTIETWRGQAVEEQWKLLRSDGTIIVTDGE